MTSSKKSFMVRWGRYLALGVISALITIVPVTAAEKIDFIYSPLDFSIQVDSLETFAREGKIDKNLELYLRKTTPQQREEFRKALLQKTEVNPVHLYRFFNSYIGEEILRRLGNLINIQGGSNGKYALRAAIVQAALDPEEGLTLLNFLRKLPTNVQIDLEKVIAVSDTIEIVLEGTNFFTKEIGILAAMEVEASNPVNFATLPDIGQPGEYGVRERRITLTDTSRQRSFYVIIYQPQRWRSGKTPVIIYSHGLASRPKDYSKRAAHLASYGYVVAMPQHPGSDVIQTQNLLAGYTKNVFELQEFVNRPLDVRYVIDELARRNNAEFDGRLDLENVGVSGHSFGGYTALAVSGAKIDFENLAADCQREFSGLNISLLLQCRALDLPRQDYNFRDDRIKAVFTENPVNSSIFGLEGLGEIEIPTLLGAGSYDPATPAVYEQVRSFPWLRMSDKYLALVEGQAHVDFSQLDAGTSKAIESVAHLTLPSPSLLDEYANATTLAFFEVHLVKNEAFRPYLQSSYLAYLSQDQTFKSFLITSASSERLIELIQKFRAKYDLLPQRLYNKH